MAIQKTECIILRRDEFRETSIILTVYTKDFGKLKLISKGVRSPEQKFISAYELFSLSDIVFYEKKKKGILLLSQCELRDFFPKVRESLDRLSYATYFVELVNSVTPFGEKNKKLYELLKNCLQLLSTKASSKRVARILEIKLLSILGFMPRMKSCSGCDKEVKKVSRFSFSLGGVLCEDCIKKDRGARVVLPGTIKFISHINELEFSRTANIKVASAVGKDTERLLNSFIRYHLDIRLRSLDFIKKLEL